MFHITSRRSPTARDSLVLSVVVGLAVFMAAGPVYAVKAYPFPFTIYQPNGIPITVAMIGDERIVFHETEDGYTILRQPNGWWVYADPVSNGADELAPSRLRAGIDPVPAPVNLRRCGRQRSRRNVRSSSSRVRQDPKSMSTLGEKLTSQRRAQFRQRLFVSCRRARSTCTRRNT